VVPRYTTQMNLSNPLLHVNGSTVLLERLLVGH
jgi:hypothetical protein